MNIIWARQPIPSSIFLAGPTPRDPAVQSWRPEALKILNKLNFQGTVFVPEDEKTNTILDHESPFQYDSQVEWEWKGLEASTLIVFWVPRELKTMPAFTTNVEFGRYVSTGRCLLGYPDEAEKMAYLQALADRFHVPTFYSLEKMLQAAVVRC